MWDETFIRKSRKPHRCYECGLPIPVGRGYVKTTAISERGDRPQVYAVHPECDAIRDFIRRDICEAHGTDGGILMGGLAEEIGELNEYTVATESERDELAAMGWNMDEDGVREVVEWLWDAVKDGYRLTTGAT